MAIANSEPGILNEYIIEKSINGWFVSDCVIFYFFCFHDLGMMVLPLRNCLSLVELILNFGVVESYRGFVFSYPVLADFYMMYLD